MKAEFTYQTERGERTLVLNLERDLDGVLHMRMSEEFLDDVIELARSNGIVVNKID